LDFWNDCEECAGQNNQELNTKAALGTTLIVAGLAILLAGPTGGTSVAAGGLILGSSTAAVAGSAMAVTGTVIVGDAAVQATVYSSKKSKKSDKEKSNDHPSWLSRSDVDLGKSAHENATELLNNKYGVGNWRKGPGSEYNIIVKWINRGLKAFFLFLVEKMVEDQR